jgi:hypothetical protein
MAANKGCSSASVLMSSLDDAIHSASGLAPWLACNSTLNRTYDLLAITGYHSPEGSSYMASARAA